MAFGFFKGTKAKLLPTTGIEFSDGRFYTYGAGSPEGVVTATIGSFYSDTTAGSLYTKNSGSGDTGWAISASLTAMASGTSSVPGLAFSADTDTGFYLPGANQLGFITGGDERLRIESTGQIKAVYESEVGTDYNTTLHNGYFCRAWVNFNGTGTPAIRASGNVSSITDNGTGDFTINFTTALPDTDYTINANMSSDFAGGTYAGSVNLNRQPPAYTEQAPTTSAFRIFCITAVSAAFDPKYVNISVFR